MGRAGILVAASLLFVGCSSGDDSPNQITRIDGPAVVDEERLNNGVDDSSDG
ncbi:MAG: hypothetical protein AB8G14_03535 [Ilumatobacter sp.]